MSRDFVPAGDTYNINQPRTGDFTLDEAELLARMGDNMDIKKARSEGRVPSPLSRAHMFYVKLFRRSLSSNGRADDGDDTGDEEDLAESDAREEMHERARHTFRGLLAAFALRDVLGLEIEFKRVTLRESDALGNVLLPALKSAPEGQDFWRDMPLYTWTPNRGEEEVLAGGSPLTGFFPSAHPPQQLTGLFWYDHDSGTWYDPTSDALDGRPAGEGQFSVSSQTRRKVRRLLKAWLQHVTDQTSPKRWQQEPFLLRPRSANQLMSELKAWQNDLQRVPAPDDPVNVETPDGDSDMFPPLKPRVEGATPEHLLSDLPLHQGRLVVTTQQLRDKDTRLYGRLYGKRSLGEHAETIPAKGDNLGEALGLGSHRLPMPYVLVDQLFTPKLTTLASDGFSTEWSGLEVEEEGTSVSAPIPLEPEILEIMSPAELKQSLSAELAAEGSRYIVTLQFGDVKVPQTYDVSGEGDYTLDRQVTLDDFDLRLFPNFDLEKVSGLLPSEDDQRYFARMRKLPSWDFRAEPFAYDETSGKRDRVNTAEYEFYEFGNDDSQAMPNGSYSPGKAVFYRIDETPRGFHLPERGFCLVDLRDPRTAGVNEKQWRVGLDFGTSNTCLSFSSTSEDGRAPEILTLPSFTTTLFETPNYHVRDEEHNVFEGASAVLDFFYRFGGEPMMSQDYFPTQLLTQQEQVENDQSFDLRNGLIHFDNIGVSDPLLTDLIEAYPQTEEKPFQRFEVKHNIKWKNQKWLRVFMHHLRKQVVLTAASQNARIDELHYSYPKSFGPEERLMYQSALEQAWGEDVIDKESGRSESEAVRSEVAGDDNSAHVVFDIGGGTTDLIAFNNREPVFQTSFRLAAGQVNKYVVSSPPFRSLFLKAVDEHVGWPDSFQTNTGDGEGERARVFKQEKAHSPGEVMKTSSGHMIEQLWLGLLQHISAQGGDRKLSYVLTALRNSAQNNAASGSQDVSVRASDAQARAVEGFFLTIALIFGGLAYFAGRLLGAASRGDLHDDEPFNMNRVTLRLAGNGSRLYQMMPRPFETALEQLFEDGLEKDVSIIDFDGLQHYEGRVAPKVIVALGLLKNTGDTATTGRVPVANTVGEEGYDSSDGSEAMFDRPLLDFYQTVEDPGRFSVPQEVPPVLRRFLDQLDDALPYGRAGEQGEIVVPGADRHWCDRLKTEVYKHAKSHLDNRLKQTASETQGVEQLPEGARPALEPIFIAELASLIEAIRELHATPEER